MHKKLNFQLVNDLAGGPAHIWGAYQLDDTPKWVNVRDLLSYKAARYELLVQRQGMAPQSISMTHEQLWTSE